MSGADPREAELLAQWSGEDVAERMSPHIVKLVSTVQGAADADAVMEALTELSRSMMCEGIRLAMAAVAAGFTVDEIRESLEASGL